MPEHDLTDRIAEQVVPIIQTITRRMESDLTDVDKAAIGHGVVDAATMGARVAWAAIVANAAEAGVDVSRINIGGLESQNLWPFPE